MLATLLALAAAAACTTRASDAPRDARELSDGGAAAAVAPPDPIAELRPFEDETRRSFDFAKPPSAETGLGADPWTLRHVAHVGGAPGAGGGYVGILRGRSAIVLLDEQLHELARLPAPRSPTGLALGKNGEILVVGELSPMLARYTLRGGTLVAIGEQRVPGVFGLRDVATTPAGVVWALDERGGHLLRIGDTSPTSLPVGHGAAQLVATNKHLVVNAVTDHTISVFALDGAGAPIAREPLRITHDGPMWGFDARETDAGLVVAAGGVEDHPLDRKGGFFGYIDSFVFAYRVHDARIDKVAELNVSEQGVVTPKAIAVEAADAEHIDLLVTAYGSPTGLRTKLVAGRDPASETLALLPGIRSVEHASASAKAGSLAMANPLLDAWVAVDEHGVHVVPVANEPPRPVTTRLGEALFFTSLMAPKNTSTGALSRFTCETCHFEGYVDGRTHHTGREEIHATTKPLVGLVGNRPYFSRALDPDLSTVSHAEFRVAGAGSTTDPFFAIEPSEHAWVEHVGVHERVEPLALRRALLRFLVDFSHRPNSAVIGHAATFDALEREGAQIFGKRCEGCHAARLSADDPTTRVAEGRWEAMILGESAPIVWGSAGYQKTGVVPYVHTDGARTPSLRRLYKKHPYFTNGSAKSIDDVLDTLRFAGERTFHGSAPAGAEELDAPSKRALHAFLELL